MLLIFFFLFLFRLFFFITLFFLKKNKKYTNYNGQFYPLKSLRVVDLRKELEKRNLSKTGKKEELLARLEQALLEEKEENNTNNTKEEEEEEEEKEEKAKIDEKGEEDEGVQETTDNTTEKELQSENNIHEQQTPIETIPQPIKEEKNEPMPDNDTTKEETQEQQSTLENKEEKMDTSNVDNTASKEDKMEEDQGNKRKREEDNNTDIDKRVKTDDDSKSIKDTELTKDNESSKTSTTTNHLENEEQTAICIKNLLRPLVARDVRDLVGKYGEVKRLFIDHVKTHCYANYETVKEANDALENIDGIQFPPETGKIVSVIKLYPSQVEKLVKREQELENQGMIRPPWEKFLNNVLNNVDIDEGINDDSNNSNTNTNSNDSTNNPRKRISALEQITKQLNQRTAISTIGQAKDRKSKSILERLSTSSTSSTSATRTTKMPVGKSLDELFLKTTANPPLYYLPVDDAIAKERLSSLNKEKI
ncbi:unnamed protein product [Cunninghamella echinulata]